MDKFLKDKHLWIYPLILESVVTTINVQGQPFLLPTFHSKRRHDLDHYFKTDQINIDVIIETQDTSVQNLMAVR
ncbi:MAG: hypothetical protein HN646_10155 [Nitrospina sp.]|nr:hypothetical protein [Nitrospina sp.]